MICRDTLPAKRHQHRWKHVQILPHTIGEIVVYLADIWLPQKKLYTYIHTQFKRVMYSKNAEYTSQHPMNPRVISFSSKVSPNIKQTNWICFFAPNRGRMISQLQTNEIYLKITKKGFHRITWRAATTANTCSRFLSAPVFLLPLAELVTKMVSSHHNYI